VRDILTIAGREPDMGEGNHRLIRIIDDQQKPAAGEPRTGGTDRRVARFLPPEGSCEASRMRCLIVRRRRAEMAAACASAGVILMAEFMSGIISTAGLRFTTATGALGEFDSDTDERLRDANPNYTVGP